MSTRIICAAIATLAVLSNTAEAAGFNHIPSVPRPVFNTAPPSGSIRTSTVITHTSNFTRDTRVFSDQNGKVVMAISSLTRKPAAATPSHLVPSQGAHNSGTATPGLAHNTSNSKNTTNSQNISQAQQSHSGANCNATLHKLRMC